MYLIGQMLFSYATIDDDFQTEAMTSFPSFPSNGSPPACDEYLETITRALDALNEAERLSSDRVEGAIDSVFVPVVSAFGIVGNLLNLIVLTRKRLSRSMDHMEKSAQMGLVALALSDMIICALYLFASSVVPSRVVYTPYDRLFALYFSTYQEALMNIFLLSGTWLTVTMAISRYLVVCRPMHARVFIGLRGTRAVLVGDFVGSLILNLPRFWHYVPTRHPCSESGITAATVSPLRCPCFYHVKQIGALYNDKVFVFTYSIVTSIVGIFGPLLILTGCNVCLVWALRRSQQLQKRSMAAPQALQTRAESRHRITPTLIALIVLFIVLVTPSEIVNFFREHIDSTSGFLIFKTSTKIFNFLPLINFAVNFLLYCILNVHFRQTFRDVILCRRHPESKDSVEQRYSGRQRNNQRRITATETGL